MKTERVSQPPIFMITDFPAPDEGSDCPMDAEWTRCTEASLWRTGEAGLREVT